MTNEQLIEYERLDNAVQLAHDNLSGEMLMLAAMHIRQSEAVTEYVIRVENAILSLQACKREWEKAKADKTAFVRAV